MIIFSYFSESAWERIGGRNEELRWELCALLLCDRAMCLGCVLVGTGLEREKTKLFLIPTCLSS